MAERELLLDMEYEVVKQATVMHHGLFKVHDILHLIHSWAKDHDYYKETPQTKTKALETARSQHRSFELYKRTSMIYTSVIEIGADFSDMKDKIIVGDGTRESFQDGSVEINLKGFNMSSAKFRWESRPAIAFVRGIIDKFVYKINRGTEARICATDTTDLARQLRSLLHSYKKRFKSERS